MSESAIHAKAVQNVWLHRIYTSPIGKHTIVHLVPEDDMRTLIVDWWNGKEISLLAVDAKGRFFTRHSDGSVQLWDHDTQLMTRLENRVSEFLEKLERDENAIP